jgi:beta-lactamase regulating signal transducer with metallopeptidase domain
MITYIFKTILCSALLILIYHLFLEKEKMHGFNRFYLLFGIAFSFIVPLITIKTKVFGYPISESIKFANTNIQSSIPQQILPSINDSFSLSNILLVIYVTVTAFLFCRFIVNISVIFIKIRNNNSVKYLDTKLILTSDDLIPHSFLNYVFVHFKDFERGTIEKEILSHELTHVKQRHSIDILFIELLMIFAWINPLLFLYRKAVQLNHEFLADEFVVSKFSDTQTYQLLLLDKATRTNNLLLSSPFNYLLTKKRIIMMSKKTSFKVAILKQIALIPVIAIIGLLFTTKTVAQDRTIITQQHQESTLNGVSQKLLKEYQDIMNKYKKTLSDGKESYNLNVPPPDRNRLAEIFFQMSKEQQAAQIFVFKPNSSIISPKHVPTKEQLDSFKDPKMYGVWVDGKLVNNEVLINYINTDFSQFFESKLAKNATNYGKHVYQVNLMTNDYYQKYYNKTLADKGYTFMIRDPKKDSTK